MRAGNEDVEAVCDVAGVVGIRVGVGRVDEALREEFAGVVTDAGGVRDGVGEGGEDDVAVVAEAAEGGVHVRVWGAGDSGEVLEREVGLVYAVGWWMFGS